MALLEGLSFGVPTVFSDIPENTAVADGLGFPFRVSDAEDLAGKIDFVLSHDGEAGEIGRKAKETVKRRHDWREIAARYNELYKSFQ